MHDHLLSPWRQGLCQSSYVLCGGSDGIGEEKKEEDFEEKEETPVENNKEEKKEEVPVIIPVETEKEETPVVIPVETEKEVKLESIPISI